MQKSGEAIPAGGIEFKLTDSDDLVVFNNSVTKVGAIIEAERKKKPGFSVCYHKVVENPEKLSEFKLEQTHKVVFVPSLEAETLTQNSVACKVDEPTKWNTHAVRLMWMVRVTQKGLQAIGPRAYSKVEMVLPPGHACQISD